MTDLATTTTSDQSTTVNQSLPVVEGEVSPNLAAQALSTSPEPAIAISPTSNTTSTNQNQSTPTETVGPAPTPSVPIPIPIVNQGSTATTSFIPGMGSQQHRFQIRVRQHQLPQQPQVQQQQQQQNQQQQQQRQQQLPFLPRPLPLDPASGQLRLDLGNGNIVTIPLPTPHGQSQPRVFVSSSSSSIPNQPNMTATATTTTNSTTNTSTSTATLGSTTIPSISMSRPIVVAGPSLIATTTGTNATSIPHAHNAVRSVNHLPPLLPIPVATVPSSSPPSLQQQQSQSQQNDDPDDDDEEDSLSRFKCAVCYEFMKDPVGCPSETCSARFCQECFVRAARESSSTNHVTTVGANGSTTITGGRPKCPTCRVEFTHYVPDIRLKVEMMNSNGPTAPCRHPGCPERKLPLFLVQEHEGQCPFEQLKCRYAPFGCSWIGRRGDLDEHERKDCALHRVSFLVNKLRELDVDHSNRLMVLQQQQNGFLQMLHIHRQTAQRDTIKSMTNLFDIIHYIHTLSCSTLHFLHTKERWNSFFGTDQGRGTITNFLVLIPTILSCGCFALMGVRSIPRLLMFLSTEDETTTTTTNGGVGAGGGGAVRSLQSPSSSESFDVFLDDTIMRILIGIMTGLALLANFVDTGSSVSWGKFHLYGQLQDSMQHPIMCDLLALCLFTMHLTLIESSGFFYHSLMVWVLLCTTTTVFPAMIMTMSRFTAHQSMGITSSSSVPPSVLEVMTSARSLEPVLFGLRYSVICIIFGFLPTLDAAAMTVWTSSFLLSRRQQEQQHQQVQQQQRYRLPWLILSSLFGSRNCFFDGLANSTIRIYLSIRIGMILMAVLPVEAGDGMFWIMSLLNPSTIASSTSSSGGGGGHPLLGFMEMCTESFVAYGLLMWITAGLNNGLALGIQCGHWTMKGVEQELAIHLRGRSSDALLISGLGKDYQLFGLTSFGIWISLTSILLCLQ